MKAQELSKLLVFAIGNNFPILIKGKPGIGKSDIVAQATKQANAHLIISHPVVSDPTDYKGMPALDKDGNAHFMPFGELQALIDAKEPTVFFLDDLGQAPASVQAACMQLILARRVNGHKVSDQVTFIAATNRKEDSAGVSGLLEPVKSRFASIVELEVSTDDWVQWALDNNMPMELIAFMRFRPELIDKFKATKELVNSPTPRTIANLGRLQNAGANKFAETEFEIYKGAVGESFAIEYKSFIDIYRSLPSIDDICLNPNTAPISDNPATLYAISGAIVNKMSVNNIEALVTYLERLPVEYQTLTMQDGAARKKEVAFTKPYVKWMTKHGNLINR